MAVKLHLLKKPDLEGRESLAGDEGSLGDRNHRSSRLIPAPRMGREKRPFLIKILPSARRHDIGHDAVPLP